MSEAIQPIFSIEKIYVKDLSLEIPHAPRVFLEAEAPQVEIQLHNGAQQIDPGLFDVVLTVTITAKSKDKTVFLIEVAQAGIFQIRNIPQADLDPLLGIACPNILFPYVREVVSSVSTRAGFPAVQLAPVSFEAIYAQQRQAQATAPAAPVQ